MPRPGTTVEIERPETGVRKSGSPPATSGINDGAAALIVLNHENTGARRGAAGAKVLAHAVTGVDPMVMGIGPITAAQGPRRAR